MTTDSPRSRYQQEKGLARFAGGRAPPHPPAAVTAGQKRAEPLMFSRRSFSVLLLVAGLALAGPVASAAADAGGFINELVTQALKTLDNKQLTNEDRAKKFRDLLDTDFDIPRIARFVLGRYWNEASEQDRQQFQKLFEEHVVRSYAQRFPEYSGEQLKIIGQRPESETSTLVQSHIVGPNGGPPAKVDWRVRKEGDGFKIIDVDVEGVSMVLAQREEFTSVIQRSGGVAGLNKIIQEKLARGDSRLAAQPAPAP
jgi:phospholipid transport system substrate-binding protein